MSYYLTLLLLFLTISCLAAEQLLDRQSDSSIHAMLHDISTQIDKGDMNTVRRRCQEILQKEHFKSLHEEQQIRLYLYEITALNQLEEYDVASSKTEYLLTRYKGQLQKYPKHYRETYYQMGYTASGLHNQKLEIQYTQKALAIMESHPNLFAINDFIQIYNDLYYYQINYDDIQEMEITYRKYLDFFTKNRPSFHREQYGYARRVLRKMELTEALNKNEPQKAQDILNRFLDEVPKPFHTDDIPYLNSCYSSINTYYYFEKQYTEAIAFARKYLTFARQTNDTWNIMLAYSKIGISYEQLGNYWQAIRYIDLSMQAFSFEEFSASLFALHIIKAKCLSGLKQHHEAVKLAEQTIKQIISHKLGKKSNILDFDIAQIKDLNSHNYINIFASAALIFIEKHKHDRQRNDLLKAEKILRTSSEMFREFYLKGEYNSLLYNLHLKNTEGLLYVASEKYSQDPQNLAPILNIIEENASKHLYKNYLRKSEATAEQKGLLQIDNLGNLITQVQQKVDKNEQILKYYVLADHAYRVSITNREISLQQIGKTTDIKQTVLDYLQQIKTIKPNYKQYASHLTQTLLPENLNKKNIIISDNFLNYLPFEALYDVESTKFRVEQYDFSYSYSLALWLLHHDGQHAAKNISAIIFNPDYTRRSMYQDLAIVPLPHSRSEAQQIGHLLDATIVNHTVHKQDVVNRLNSPGLYHFSMHAYLDEDNFNRSCLLFSEGEPLFFEELYHMYIPADMVVLGACNTGNGKLKNGEGVMSLSMAFSFAGTRSSLYSLWNVPDAETAELLGYFYKNLKKGCTKDEALGNAKKEFIRQNPMKSHPFFWAGFIVNGDTSPIFPKHRTTWIFISLIGAMIVVGILTKYGLKRKFHIFGAKKSTKTI